MPAGPSPACVAQRLERDGVLEPEAARGGPDQRAEVRAAAERLAEVAGERPDVRPGRARDVDDGDRAAPGPLPSHSTSVDGVDRRRRAARARRRLAGARQLVRPPALDLDGAVVGRDLPMRAGERRRAPPRPASRSGAGPSTGVRSPSMSSVVERSPKHIVAR